MESILTPKTHIEFDDIWAGDLILAASLDDNTRILAAVEGVLEQCEHMDRSKPVGDWYYNEITGAIQWALGGTR